jgi:hypothetical protein
MRCVFVECLQVFYRCHVKHAATRLQLLVCCLQKVIGFVSAGAVATLFLVGGFCAIPL